MWRREEEPDDFRQTKTSKTDIVCVHMHLVRLRHSFLPGYEQSTVKTSEDYRYTSLGKLIRYRLATPSMDSQRNPSSESMSDAVSSTPGNVQDSEVEMAYEGTQLQDSPMQDVGSYATQQLEHKLREMTIQGQGSSESVAYKDEALSQSGR